MNTSGAVYRHFSASGELLYVGYSARPLDRNVAHRHTAKWFKEIASITIQWFDSREDALDAELVAIQSESPRENIRDVTDSPIKRRITKRREPFFVSQKPHPQLDALDRSHNLAPLAYVYFKAGFNVEWLNQIRESGRELFASEVIALARALYTKPEKLEKIGLHMRNPG